jgi:hypothetical protein
MGRRSALVVVGALVFALAACGGDSGGGDEEAFCDSLDALSGLVEDGDLADDGGLGDAVDIANDLRETASDDQADAIQEVGETLSEADPDEAADTAELIQDELGDFADDCEIDEFAEAPEEETTTTTEPDDTTTTSEVEDTTTTTEGGGGGGETNELGALIPVPADLEPEFAALANECFVGNVAACDDIFFGTDGQGAGAAPQGSVARDYAASCAGRVARFVEGQPTECVGNFFLASAPDVTTFSDPSFEGLAQACFANDMQACDDLFLQTGVGSAEELYGETCGFRLDAAVTGTAPSSCTTIFGPTAFG